MKINILTQGLRSYNSIAFLTPLILNQKKLKEMGLDVKFFTRLSKRLTKCDILVLESKFFIKYWQDTNQLFTILQSLKKENKVYFFSLGDSTSSWVLGVLPFVDRLYQSYLFRDKLLYTKPLYGGRIWTDYYHRQFGVIDDNRNNEPNFYANEKELDKIRLSYSSAFGNYTLDSIFWHNTLKAKLVKRLWFLHKLSIQKVKTSSFVSMPKQNNISARMSINSYTNTVAFQRKETAKILKKFNTPNKPLSRENYMRELAISKVVVSPFGWGEINYKDYEVALSGAVLLKPNFSHLKTWPPIFNDKTVVQYNWNFSDLENKINNIVNNYDDFVNFSINLQNNYKHFVTTEEGQYEFCQYFKNILK